MSVPGQSHATLETDRLISDFSLKAKLTVEQLQATTEPNDRLREVAALAISFFDLVDSLDHETSTTLDGSIEVQRYANKGREESKIHTVERIPLDKMITTEDQLAYQRDVEMYERATSPPEMLTVPKGRIRSFIVRHLIGN